MDKILIIIIIIGIWGAIAIVGNTIEKVAQIKAKNNPLSKFFGGKDNEEEK